MSGARRRGRASNRQLQDPRLHLLIDATAVGRPVVDLVHQAVAGTRCRISAATFTHGDRYEAVGRGDEVRVGKAHLVSRLQVLLQSESLRLPETPEARNLAEKLFDYEIRVDENANDRYGAFRVVAHDGLVTALGLAVLGDPRGRRKARVLVAKSFRLS